MRAEERVEIDEPARLHPNDWSNLEVRLLDVSANGFRAECEARVPAGSCVSLEVPGKGLVIAYVTWRRSNRFGARFLEPLDVAQSGWSAMPKEQLLARMLVDRSHARGSGELGREVELRRRILDSLPIRRGHEAAGGSG